ncbi:MAG: FAD-dependent oxidoreductase [Cellulomonas sp.]
MAEPRVVVVGGGYAGATIATSLDAVADVTLVEPKDSFVHATGALRAAVDVTWEDRVFFPYDHLLTRGRVVHEYAQAVTSTQVRVSAGRVVDADYLVLATGTAYPFPAKFIESDVLVAKARLARLRESLREARSVMIVGAGPVGLELAGELSSAFPAIDLVIVDQAEDALTTGDYLPALRSAIRSQLDARGVSFALGSPLGYLPPVDVGVFAPFTVHTRAGRRIDADLWFRCYGNQPVTDYLVGDLAGARLPDGRVAVAPTLNVRGFPTVFAIGDITDVPESKRASAAIAHAHVAAANIRALIEGGEPVTVHEPAAELVVLPLGPDGGASQLLGPDGTRHVLGASETSAMKGADLYSTAMAELFGAVPRAGG